MIEYIKGDVFKTECKVIAHGVNCQGVMGAGVAKVVKEDYPKSYEGYTDWCLKQTDGFRQDSQMLLGASLMTAPENGKRLIHCFTQNYYGKLYMNDRHVSYDAVHDAFMKIPLMVDEEIAMPMIGAGLGGGSWPIIEAIIKETIVPAGINVKVYQL